MLGVDCIYDEPPIDQTIDNRSVRYLDRYGDSACGNCNRKNPSSQLCQTRGAVRELSFSYDGALSIKNAGLMLF